MLIYFQLDFLVVPFVLCVVDINSDDDVSVEQ